MSPGDGVDRKNAFFAHGQGLGRAPPQSGEPASARTPGDRNGGHLVLAGEERDRLEGPGVADPGKHELGPEQRQEPVRLAVPPRPGLCEVLQAGQRHDTLAATLGNERREVVQGRDVRQFVEDEKKWRPRE
jgi:hypothetical protein